MAIIQGNAIFTPRCVARPAIIPRIQPASRDNLSTLISGAVFGRYLATYAFTYVSMYAGLASVMIALVFLYVCACIFIFGGELNAAIVKARESE